MENKTKKKFTSVTDYCIKYDDEKSSYKVFIDLDNETVGVINLHKNFLAAVLTNSKTKQPSQ